MSSGTVTVSLPFDHPLCERPFDMDSAFTVDITQRDGTQRFRGLLRGVQKDSYGFTLTLELLDSTPVAYGPPDEDRIREAMTEAQAHPGRIVTR